MLIFYAICGDYRRGVCLEGLCFFLVRRKIYSGERIRGWGVVIEGGECGSDRDVRRSESRERLVNGLFYYQFFVFNGKSVFISFDIGWMDF